MILLLLHPILIYTFLMQTCKQKVFRAAYYQIKECCKQLILIQKVDIVKYELPSSEEDIYYANQSEVAQGIRSSGGADTSSKVEITTSTTSPISQSCCPPGTPVSMEMACCTQGGTRRKLCQKCGQKFLAAL